MRSTMALIGAALLFASCGGGADQGGVDLGQRLLGEWRWMGYTIEFNEDGDYTVGTSEFGDYELDGDTITFLVSDESRFCPGTVGTYMIEFVDDGTFHQSLIEDDCEPRVAVGAETDWDRVE
jgi:hypothetical protein